MAAALDDLADVAREFARISGREYRAVEPYALEDAERAVVLLGSTACTAKDVVDELRRDGERVGVLEVRAFRPFPEESVRALLSRLAAVAVLDRPLSPGARPPPPAPPPAAPRPPAPPRRSTRRRRRPSTACPWRRRATSTASAGGISTPRR